jgi:Mg-chelatase subunit ChlD
VKNFTRFLHQTAGNVSLFLGIAAFPLMAAVGVATDMVRINATRTVLQNAADAAAIAGAASTDKSEKFLKKTVGVYLESNHSTDVLQYVTDIDHKLDPVAGTFTVKIAGTVPGSFMSLLGFKNLSIDALSVVQTGSSALELALVLDNTGSMAGSKIVNLKAAATDLVNTIEAASADSNDVKMAVVPFAEYVNVGMGNSGQSWLDKPNGKAGPWTGCVGSRPAPYDMQISASGGNYPGLAGVACNSALLPLTSNLKKVKSAISTMTATGWTYIPGGLVWGWNVLDADAPFTEGKSKSQNKLVNGRKVIVLMTDGENTRSPTYPLHNGTNVVLANTKLKDTCTAVKADGIEIFTVSFMVTTPTVKNILQNCATETSRYYDAANAAELSAAFNEIASNLADVRLSQ